MAELFRLVKYYIIYPDIYTVYIYLYVYIPQVQWLSPKSNGQSSSSELRLESTSLDTLLLSFSSKFRTQSDPEVGKLWIAM